MAKKFAEILDIYEDISAYSNIANNLNAKSGITIRIAINNRFADSYSLKLLNKYNIEHPEIEILTESFDNPSIIYQLNKNENINIGIITVIENDNIPLNMESVLSENQLLYVPFFQDNMYLVGTTQSLRNSKIKNTKDLMDYSTVVYRYGADFHNSPAHQVNSITSQKEMITQQNVFGIYTLDEFNMHFNTKKYAYAPFEEKVTLNYGFVFQKDYILSQTEKSFIDFTIDYFNSKKYKKER